MKYHFLCSIIFAVSLGFLTINESQKMRMILVVPALIFFFLTLIFFATEYDSERSRAWKKHEKNMAQDIYIKYFRNKKKFN